MAHQDKKKSHLSQISRFSRKKTSLTLQPPWEPVFLGALRGILAALGSHCFLCGNKEQWMQGRLGGQILPACDKPGVCMSRVCRGSPSQGHPAALLCCRPIALGSCWLMGQTLDGAHGGLEQDPSEVLGTAGRLHLEIIVNNSSPACFSTQLKGFSSHCHSGGGLPSLPSCTM